MRVRTPALLATLAVAGVVLAGCSGSSEPAATPDAGNPLCALAAPTGDAVDAVTVEGEFGELSDATFEAGIEVPELQRAVVEEGEGPQIVEGDWVDYAISVFDASTGDRIGDVGYEPAEQLPTQVSAQSGLGQVFGCAEVGSRLVAAFPQTGDPAAGGAAAQIYILDVLGITPLAAWGEEQEPREGFPTVSLAENGEPSVEVPDAAPPADLEIEVLKQGDGPEVEAGDTTLLQYYGVNWETGESFDSSWTRGQPTAIPGNTYVEGFVQALEGQAVGSQVLVSIPPALAYGESPDSTHELADQTLVFVIDILATQHAPAQG